MKRIRERNERIRESMYKLLDKDEKDLNEMEIMKLKPPFGTKEWSDSSHNINNSKFSCPNGCIYCYIKTYENSKLKVSKTLIVNKKKVHRKFNNLSKKNSVVMFPTAHDIFESCVDDYLISAKNILKCGHDLLVVSKPRIPVIKKLCDKLRDYKDRVEFRFTICTDKPEIKKIWERWAPPIEERMECVKIASENGYHTSISLEPLLSNPSEIIKKLDPYVDSAFWIGFMNHLEEIDIEEIHKKRVETLKDPEFVFEIIKNLRSNKKVFWKESVIKFVKSELLKKKKK